MSHKQLAIPVVFVLFGAAMMLPNLGHRSLWSDEAGTALFARTILTHGIPIAFDGVNVAHSSDFNNDLVLVKLPWLPYYMAAGSFVAIGVDGFSARLPFVFLSLGTIALFWFRANELFTSRRAAIVTTLILVLSTAFLLYSRQCRYYSPCIFFTLLSMSAYPKLSLKSKRSLVLMIIAMVGLFHSNYLVFFCLAGAWLADFLAFDRSSDKARAGLVATISIAVLTLPWLVYAESFSRVAGDSEFDSALHMMKLFVGYFMKLNWLCLLPMVFMIALPLTIFHKTPDGWKMHTWPMRMLMFIAVYIGLLAVFGPKPASSDFIAARYVICLVPACCLLVGWLIDRAWTWRPWLGAAVLALHLTTNVFTLYAFTSRAEQPDSHDIIAAPYVRMPLINYIYEITHRQPDAYGAIANYLLKNGQPDDLVLTVPYHTAEPLIFLTNMRFCARIDQVAYKTGDQKKYPRDKLPDYI